MAIDPTLDALIREQIGGQRYGLFFCAGGCRADGVTGGEPYVR